MPFETIQRVSEAGGKLSIVFDKGTLNLDLGGEAKKWLNKIKNPKSLIEKLGVKAGMKVSVQGIQSDFFLKELKEKGVELSNNSEKMSDLIFLQIDSKQSLKSVNTIAKKLVKNGALWIVYPKGKEEIKQDDVFKAGKAANLVDVKVVSFSPTHTALKFVIPTSMRI